MSESKPVAMVQPSQCQYATQARQQWVVTLPNHATNENIETPGFWAGVAAQFIPQARLEIWADDGSWLVDAVVLANDRTWAKVHVLKRHQLSKVDTSMFEGKGLIIEWGGPTHRFRVVRESDKKILAKKLDDREAAAAWVREHEFLLTG